MKSIINRIAIALLVTSLASGLAFAKTKRQTVTFETDIKVNGTVVSKGVYDVKYDDAAGELTIAKGSKVIARTTTRVEKRDRKAQQFELRSLGTGEETELTGITFAGSDHNVVIGNSQATR
ncbi:MAG: hypothetical protein H7Z16_13410 [Pyrinomonadaceae bacterium]|nr:hypothetical protein [Pyrinomonadaceae bacterium]